MPVTTHDTWAAERQLLGAYGERLAVGHLVRGGMVILDRNWRCRDGEIDIVAMDGTALVFCEVKTRSSGRFGPPAEAVVAAKARRLRGLAVQWLDKSRRHAGQIRFDVVSVLVPEEGPAQVEHFRGVL